MPMATAARKVSVPAILLLLAVLSCLLLVHGLYGLLELFGPPDLSPPEATTMLIFALCFLLLLAAAAAGNRRALLPREAADYGPGQALPTTAEEAAVGGEEPHHQLADDEEMAESAARRAGLLQTQDYPGSGPNSRHDPRNPH
ncbi:hypothetical protein BAE44_0022504 [Dichanthelium oligosanthes]|uniref:Uncharacterized protein n=1 Tax=Dichanthelium oligosanthes TaxID=888268 RepID=A0A1E5UUD4_9POAL|nr:hypothetical protein BAE44_0022504 [Dichanthelium oligosanthes]